MNINSNKRGQVTLFIIVAIVIVVIGALIYFLYPRITSSSTFDVENPERFIQDCVEDDLRILVKDLAMHGISLDPTEPFAWYDTEKIQYLCYTPNYGEVCTRSPLFLITEFQDQISENIKLKVDSCFDSLEEAYASKGYIVDSKRSSGQINTKILPQQTILELVKYEITVSKGTSQKYNSFNILLNNNLYELLVVSSKILEDEVRFGEADRLKYMLATLDLNITASEYSEGTNIYIVESKKTKEKFQFASRSLVSQPGI